MKFAQIKDGVVKNIISLMDESILNLFSSDPTDGTPFDAIVCIDNLDPMPCIDWLYDGNNFTPPDWW